MASPVCDQCNEELEAHLIEQNYLGGRLERLFGGHVLEFPEGEYVLRVQHVSGKATCILIITASIRAAAPRLGTWRANWTAVVDTHLDVGHLVVAEILRARQRFLDMLLEHGEPVPPSSTSSLARWDRSEPGRCGDAFRPDRYRVVGPVRCLRAGVP